MRPEPAGKPSGRLAGLDGLRALCVTGVIAEHARGAAPFFHYQPFWLGVDVFFVISGLLITTLLLREESETGTVDLKAFYLRRAGRIFPLYYFILAVYFLASLANAARLHAMLRYAGYLLFFLMDVPQSSLPFGADRIPFGATWSLGIEEKFYLVFPALCFVFVPKRFRAFVVPCALVALSPLLLVPLKAQWMFRPYAGILLGCGAALLLAKRPGVFKRVPLWAPAIGVVALFLLTKLTWKVTLGFDVVTAYLLGAMILQPSAWLPRMLDHAALRKVGKMSYAMYLIHTAVLALVERFVHIHSLATATICVFAASAVAYLLAEVLVKCIADPADLRVKRYLKSRGETASSQSPKAGTFGSAP